MLTRFALSNTALPAFDHGGLLPQVRRLGFTGLEVAPGQVWADVERDASPAAVEAYRRSVEDAGLAVVGLHALFEGQPQLGLLRDGEAAQRSTDYLMRLSEICRDLGGQTLILGSGRELNGVAPDQAWHQCLAFLERLIPRIEDHGTFSAIYGHLAHFTVSEPGRVPLGQSGRIDHPGMRRHLAAGNVPGWIAVHQDATAEPLAAIARVIDEVYRRPDNLSLELRRQARAAA